VGPLQFRLQGSEPFQLPGARESQPRSVHDGQKYGQERQERSKSIGLFAKAKIRDENPKNLLRW
jgi:hypothetical protein